MRRDSTERAFQFTLATLFGYVLIVAVLASLVRLDCVRLDQAALMAAAVAGSIGFRQLGGALLGGAVATAPGLALWIVVASHEAAKPWEYRYASWFEDLILYLLLVAVGSMIGASVWCVRFVLAKLICHFVAARRQSRFRAALENTNYRHGRALRNLAQTNDD